MQALAPWLTDNPVLARELRRRMRGKVLITSIIGYVALVTCIAVFILLINSPRPGDVANTAMLQSLQQTGRLLVGWITAIQMLLVLIIAPTLTAGITTAEKEQDSFDFLRVTSISRWNYIFGCFLSGFLYVTLALFCALPILAIALSYGGITLGGLMLSLLHLLGVSAVLLAYGLFISSVVHRSRTAQGIVIGTMGGVLMLIIFGSAFIGILFAGGAMAGTEAEFGEAMRVFIFGVAVPPWVLSLGALAGATWVFLLMAARKLFDPEDVRTFAHWQYGVLVACVVTLALGVLGSNPITTEIPELAFVGMTMLLLYFGAFVFSVGRVELGDEIWHIKRLFPMTRPIDQTLFFLMGLGLGGYLLIAGLPTLVPNLKLGREVYRDLALLGVATFTVLATLGRLMTGLTMSRPIGFRVLMAATVGFGLLIPVVLASIGRIIGLPFSPWALSPPLLLAEIQVNSGLTRSIQPVIVGYTLLALVLFVVGEIIRWHRLRPINMHYDMPTK